MKETKENIKILKLLGFKRVEGPQQEDWWTLKDGWQFNTFHVKDFKTLIQNLQKTEFERGRDYESENYGDDG